MIGTAEILDRQLYLSDRINPRRERSRLFREIFKTPFLPNSLAPWLADSGAIVTFENQSSVIALRRVEAPRVTPVLR
jgi:hypothetical protein